MITAHGSEKIAVEAMKLGAEDYLPSPSTTTSCGWWCSARSSARGSQREHRLLLEQVERDYGFENLIGSGPAMQRVFETIQKVAETDLTVLVRGESGTGKELVAQALHHRSPRRGAPVRRGELRGDRRELVESELFGHEKGAFTGADARRAGTLRGRATAARSSSTRSATCRSRRRPSCCACSRSARFERVGGNAADRRRRARDRRDEPRPRGRGAAAAASARTSTTA